MALPSEQGDRLAKSKRQADATEAKDELIERVVAKGKALIEDGKTKIDAAMTMFRLIYDRPKAAVVKAFTEGASLTGKRALTYWYNCRRKEVSVNRFEVSMFGVRVSARGHTGIIGAIIVAAMILGYALAGSIWY